MPLLILILIALAASVTVAVLARRLQPRDMVLAVAAGATAEKRDIARRHPRLRAFLASRADQTAASGLALTLAVLVLAGGGLLVAMLALLLRANPDLVSLDGQIAQWSHRHAGSFSTHGLDAITKLGSAVVVSVIALVLTIFESARVRNRWTAAFLVVVVGGEHLLSATIKSLVDRARPTLNPLAQTLGPSFPSGHTTAAAAMYAAAALLLSRRRGPPGRALLAGMAAGIAVAVAASRVLLDVHWVTDVVGGLALGWAWTAACAIAFGAQLFGAEGAAVEE